MKKGEKRKLVGIIASFRTDEEEETIKAALHARKGSMGFIEGFIKGGN